MPVAGRKCLALLLLATLVVLAHPRQVRAGSSERMTNVGWAAAALGSVPLHTFALVTLAANGTSSTKEDLLFCNTLLLPFVGPAIIGTQLVESHPLTHLVCAVMWGMSVLQTAGFVVALVGHGKGSRDCDRAPHRSGRRWALFPSVTPGGVGLAGVF